MCIGELITRVAAHRIAPAPQTIGDYSEIMAQPVLFSSSLSSPLASDTGFTPVRAWPGFTPPAALQNWQLSSRSARHDTQDDEDIDSGNLIPPSSGRVCF